MVRGSLDSAFVDKQWEMQKFQRQCKEEVGRQYNTKDDAVLFQDACRMIQHLRERTWYAMPVTVSLIGKIGHETKVSNVRWWAIKMHETCEKGLKIYREHPERWLDARQWIRVFSVSYIKAYREANNGEK